MTSSPLSAEALLEPILRAHPTLDPSGQELSLALYRRLAQGEPVRVADDAAARLKGWPGVYFDDEQRVIGYWGLTLRPTTHRLRVDGRGLFAWCAWDTLFLPQLLGAKTQVASICRGSGEPIRLTVGPDGVEAAQPEGLVVSFLRPEADAIRADMVASFCHYVHFFRTPTAASAWLADQPRAFLLSLAQAYEIGRLRNQRLYGVDPTAWRRHYA